MGQEYSWEIRERAEELYIVDGRTYDQVAEATGVSVTQLKRWGTEGNWSERKREYRQALGEIRRKTVELRRNLIIKAAQSLEPQDVYAVARMEAIFARARGKETAEELPPLPQECQAIKTPPEAVAALEKLMQRKFNGLLARPESLSLGAIQEIDRIMKFIGDLKAKYQPEIESEESPGLSEEAAAEIRRQILGLQ